MTNREKLLNSLKKSHETEVELYKTIPDKYVDMLLEIYENGAKLLVSLPAFEYDKNTPFREEMQKHRIKITETENEAIDFIFSKLHP